MAQNPAERINAQTQAKMRERVEAAGGRAPGADIDRRRRPRHVDEVAVTRESLLHRYANRCYVPYPTAVDACAELSLESLRNVVEGLEGRRGGVRRGYAADQPTTAIQGIAR